MNLQDNIVKMEVISTELKKIVDPNNECCCEYHLAHKCIEWAVKEEGYMLSKLIKSEFMNMGTYTQYQVVYKQPNVEYEFFADTEPEAIFKACQWILEQKER